MTPEEITALRAEAEDELAVWGDQRLCVIKTDLLSRLVAALDARGEANPTALPPWSQRELCRECDGNGVVKIPGGVSVCPRCKGDCWEWAASPAPKE